MLVLAMAGLLGLLPTNDQISPFKVLTSSCAQMLRSPSRSSMVHQYHTAKAASMSSCSLMYFTTPSNR